MMYEGANTEIEIHDPLFTKNYERNENTIVIKQIVSIQITENATSVISNCIIVTSTANSFAFVNNATYKIVKIIHEGKMLWIGRVMNIDNTYTKSKMQSSITCASLTVNLTLAQVDYQSYKKQKLCSIIFKQLEFLLKGAEHGSPTSHIVKSDYVDNIKNNKEINTVIPEMQRQPGSTPISNIQRMLEKGGAYLFFAMVKNKPKIILNDLPVIPDSLLTEDDKYKIPFVVTGVIDSVLNTNDPNILSISLDHQASNYRDRIRVQFGVLESKLNEVASFNPHLDQLVKKGTIKKSGTVPNAEYIPMVLHRESFTKKAAEKLITLNWNNIIISTPSLSLEIAGWKFMDKDPMVGMLIDTEINITDTKGQAIVNFSNKTVKMVILAIRKTISITRGLTMQITLSDRNAFARDQKFPEYENHLQDGTTSYFTGYGGTAHATDKSNSK